MYWNLMRRSLNQRSALRESLLFLLPNIWMFMVLLLGGRRLATQT
jgi:hypothetical protein